MAEAVGTPFAVRPANIAWGTRLVSRTIMSEKKIAIEIGMPASGTCAQAGGDAAGARRDPNARPPAPRLLDA